MGFGLFGWWGRDVVFEFDFWGFVVCLDFFEILGFLVCLDVIVWLDVVDCFLFCFVLFFVGVVFNFSFFFFVCWDFGWGGGMIICCFFVMFFGGVEICRFVIGEDLSFFVWFEDIFLFVVEVVLLFSWLSWGVYLDLWLVIVEGGYRLFVVLVVLVRDV